MNFDRLLEYFDSETSQKKQVALALYYLEQYEGRENVIQSEVKSTIQRSRSSIKTSSVSNYFTRLKDDDWITSTENTGYRLTIPGKNKVTNLLDEDILNNPREDLFIDSEIFDDSYYERLIDDINYCYQHRIYDATLVLARKFFEHLTYKILQGHYGGENVEKFFNPKYKQQLGFGDLVDNSRDSVPDLRQYSRDLSKDLIDDLDQFRQEGNNGAHSIRVDVSDDEITEMSEDATRLAEVLYDVYLGVRIANKSSN